MKFKNTVDSSIPGLISADLSGSLLMQTPCLRILDADHTKPSLSAAQEWSAVAAVAAAVAAAAAAVAPGTRMMNSLNKFEESQSP